LGHQQDPVHHVPFSQLHHQKTHPHLTAKEHPPALHEKHAQNNLSDQEEGEGCLDPNPTCEVDPNPTQEPPNRWRFRNQFRGTDHPRHDIRDLSESQS